jgi:aryl-alcohol dehydrogenase-like predicted oxidoreductase
MRNIGASQVAPIGLGCMNVNHVYGVPIARADAHRLFQGAVDLGVTHFDTAALYAAGANEEWVGEALKPFRSRVYLASKCGMTIVNGKRVIDGRPEALLRTCDESLRRLQTDHVDLYYLHRWDKAVPIEESVGALGRLVEAGKVRAIGLSEVSAVTLRRAHAVHPIAAVQAEYSLWTRNVEIALLDACHLLGTSVVAFSPLGRGFFAGAIDASTTYADRDIRRSLPRFQEPHLSANLKLLVRLRELAAQEHCSTAQLALAWLLQRSNAIVAIPGTTSLSHLEENLRATSVVPSRATLNALDRGFDRFSVSGPRYPPETQAEIDTEEWT